MGKDQDREGDRPHVFAMARRAGLLDPRQIAALTAGIARWGPSLASTYAAAAIRHPRRAAVVDHRGSITFLRLDRRSSALAGGFRALGLRASAHLGILCRNHRDFVEATIAAAKAGLVPVYLNTGFSAPQLADVAAREGVEGIVCDAAFSALVEGSGFTGPIVVADGDGELSLPEVRRMARPGRDRLLPHVTAPVLLTSGTTGTPKGARRSARVDPAAAAGFFDRLPYRVGDVFLVLPPLFHAWGLAQLTVAATLASTVVLSPRFDPAHALDLVGEERVSAMAVVPIMLQRMLAGDALERSDTGGLRIVASSGSALPAPVASAWMDRVGDNLYNLYGSTEVGQASVATPSDLRAAPGTAGRVLAGSVVAILDDDGRPVPAGGQGRIFVGSGAQFDRYTGGGGKEVVDGLMASGDVGYFDDDGRLFVTGRSDDMIVSGGENVFPAEVEDLLLAEPQVADVAVIGVADEEFGQRLAAFVVLESGARLDADGVRAVVSRELARHKVPRDVTFLDELPRNPAGKVLRNRLAAPAG